MDKTSGVTQDAALPTVATAQTTPTAQTVPTEPAPTKLAAQVEAAQVKSAQAKATQAEGADLSAYLTSVDWDSCLRVRRVLKTTRYETTEEACLIAQNGAEIGTFIRKHIADDSGLGAAYQQIFDMQQRGRRFRHLPRVYSFRRLGGESTVIMEHVTGLTLQELIEREGASITLTRRVFPLLCDAVSELHESSQPPLIHRDLKPSNVIVGAENLTVIDFGTTRAYNENAQRDTTIFGTRGYAPPEQFGYRQTDVRSDVYALGMVLAFCLTGQHPQPDAVTRAVEAGEVIFQTYAAVIARAIAFDPDDRFGSVHELKEAFLGNSRSRRYSNTGSVGDPAPSAPPMPAAVPGTPVMPAMAPYPMSGNLPRNPLGNLPGNFPGNPSGSPLANQPGNKLREMLSRIPPGVGIAWNTLLWLVWLLFAAVAIYVSFSPEGEDLVTYSLTARLLMYAGLFVLATGGIAFALTDKRILRARFPDSPINRSSKVVLISAVLVVVGFVAFVVGALI